jgi:hypothetical protein
VASDRMIRAAMRESETVNGWPYALRYFWTQLWGYCDDFGRGRRDPRLVKAGTLPIDDEATVEVVDRWMSGLESAGVIRAYVIDGKDYFEVVNWDEHQEITYKKKTGVPAPDGRFPTPGKSSGKFQKSPQEGEGEREGEIEGGDVQNTPPPPFCPKHPKGTDDPCRACGNARRNRTAWESEQKNKPIGLGKRPRKGDHPCVDDGNGWCPKCGEKAA